MKHRTLGARGLRVLRLKKRGLRGLRLNGRLRGVIRCRGRLCWRVVIILLRWNILLLLRYKGWLAVVWLSLGRIIRRLRLAVNCCWLRLAVNCC